MDFETRKKEVSDSFKAPKNCLKSELAAVLLAVQKTTVDTVHNSIHAESANLRIFDALNHLKKLNSERNNVADSELAEFTELCKELNIAISAEISGNAGEAKAFKSIETLSCEYRLLKNVELQYDDHHAELDAVVITRKAIFIIEVKNPQRDIRIDERGNYYKLSNFEHFEGNIGEKMNERSYLLRKTIEDAGIEKPNIESIVVFTNSAINVENSFDDIFHAYLSQLPHIIKKYKGNFRYDDHMMNRIETVINNAKYDNEHRIPFDIDRFVNLFSTIIAKLETYEQFEKTIESEDAVNAAYDSGEYKETVNSWKSKAVKYTKMIAPVAASVVAVTVLTILEDKFFGN